MKQYSTHEWELAAEHEVADCPNIVSGIGLQDDRIAQMHPSIIEHFYTQFTASDFPVDFSPEPDPGVRANLTYYDEMKSGACPSRLYSPRMYRRRLPRSLGILSSSGCGLGSPIICARRAAVRAGS